MDKNDKPPSYEQFSTGFTEKRSYVPPPPPPIVPPGPVIATTHTSDRGTTILYNVQPKRIFTRHPSSVTCIHCNMNVVTRPRAEVGAGTWIAAVALILVGFWCGCCLIPFFVDEFKDVYHDCPNCKKTIDVHKPL